MGVSASSRFTLDDNLGVRSANSKPVAFSTVAGGRRPSLAKSGAVGNAITVVTELNCLNENA